MTRHLGLQYIPGRQTYWRSVVAFWRVGLLIALIGLTIIAEFALIGAAYFIGALIHPFVGGVLIALVVFFTLPLLFTVVSILLDQIDT